MGENHMEGACREATVDVGPDGSALILIKHCRDMKRQETCLRLVTLLLLLSCAALFILATCAHLRQRDNPGSSAQGGAVEDSPAYSKQERACPADNPQASLQRLRVHLESVHADNSDDGQYIKWGAAFGEAYEEQRAIVIPQTDFYFVYVRVTLNCHDEDGAGSFNRFNVALHSWNDGYDETLTLMEAWDGVACTWEESRSVFVGQLFHLSKGDHVKVWIGEGYKLITKSYFGAYLA